MTMQLVQICVCITTNQPDTKSNPNHNTTTTPHEVVCIQLNIVTCPTYPEKFIRDNVTAPFSLLSNVMCHAAAKQTYKQNSSRIRRKCCRRGLKELKSGRRMTSGQTAGVGVPHMRAISSN